MLTTLRQKVVLKIGSGFLLGCAAFLYFSLFVFPRVPIFLAEDPQIYLLNAARMLEGQVIYRDFFQFTSPGTELVYFVLFKLLGPRAWIPNAVLVILGVGYAWLIMKISETVAQRWASLLAGLLFLTLAYRIYFSGSTHNWYSTLAVMAAMGVVIEERTRVRLTVAAAFCGLASIFTQTRGVMALLGLAIFLLWEYRRKRWNWGSLLKDEISLFAGFLATLGPAIVYYIYRVGMRRLVYSTVLFPLRHFSSDAMYNTLASYGTDLPELLYSGSWMTHRLPGLGMFLFMHILVPFVYAVFFLRYRREAGVRPSEPWNRLMLVSVVGSLLFLGIAPAPSWFRLCSVSPPALIILAWMLGSPGKISKAALRFLGVAGLVLAVAEPVDTQLAWRAYLDAPAGRTAFLDSDAYETSQWLLHRTRPSDFLFRGIYPDYYFLLGLRDPARVPYVTATDFTPPWQVEEVVESLERHQVRFVLWSVWLDVPFGYRTQGDHLKPLRAYLLEHYHVVKTFATADFEQVWERNP